MAIKHVITLGFGFADGTAYIPTIGYSVGVSIPLPGDACRPPRRSIDAAPEPRRIAARPPRRSIDAAPEQPHDR